jgi:tetratricopeptide (TPR) repeat protein
MSTHEEAQRLLDQLRTQTNTALGQSSAGLPIATVDEIINFVLDKQYTSEQIQNLQTHAEHLGNLLVQGGVDAMMSDQLAEMQDDIEKTATQSIKEGLDVGRRPLVGFLTTGQINAVSMRVADHSHGYLVLYEDQMQDFVDAFSHVLAWAIPHDGPADSNDTIGFKFNVRDITARIESVPDIAKWFASMIVSYAIKGKLGAGDLIFLLKPMPPGYGNLASQLKQSLNYFVLSHEYAHVLLGHLDTTASRTGVLPVAEAEALVYSWNDEILADLLGALLGLQASVNHGKIHAGIAFMGIKLFFDASDVMDRAVSLLQTGDEEALQLGSHPPSYLRKQRLHESLSKMAELQPDFFGNWMQIPFKLGEVQDEIVRLLWDRTRPILLDLRRQGIQATHIWRVIPKETGDDNNTAESAGMAACYGQLGLAAQERGDYAKAKQHYVRALTICDQLDDRAGVATYSGQLGILAERQDDYDAARRHAIRALAIYEEIGDRAGVAACCQMLGSWIRFASEYNDSVRQLKRALTIYEEINDRNGMANCHGVLGSLAQNRGNYHAAKRRFAHASRFTRSLTTTTA